MKGGFSGEVKFSKNGGVLIFKILENVFSLLFFPFPFFFIFYFSPLYSSSLHNRLALPANCLRQRHIRTYGLILH